MSAYTRALRRGHYAHAVDLYPAHVRACRRACMARRIAVYGSILAFSVTVTSCALIGAFQIIRSFILT